MYFRQERNIAGKVSSVNNLYWTNIRTSVDSFNRENRIALLRYLRYKMRHFPWGGMQTNIFAYHQGGHQGTRKPMKNNSVVGNGIKPRILIAKPQINVTCSFPNSKYFEAIVIGQFYLKPYRKFLQRRMLKLSQN